MESQRSNVNSARGRTTLEDLMMQQSGDMVLASNRTLTSARVSSRTARGTARQSVRSSRPVVVGGIRVINGIEVQDNVTQTVHEMNLLDLEELRHVLNEFRQQILDHRTGLGDMERELGKRFSGILDILAHQLGEVVREPIESATRKYNERANTARSIVKMHVNVQKSLFKRQEILKRRTKLAAEFEAIEKESRRRRAAVKKDLSEYFREAFVFDEIVDELSQTLIRKGATGVEELLKNTAREEARARKEDLKLFSDEVNELTQMYAAQEKVETDKQQAIDRFWGTRLGTLILRKRSYLDENEELRKQVDEKLLEAENQSQDLKNTVLQFDKQEQNIYQKLRSLEKDNHKSKADIKVLGVEKERMLSLVSVYREQIVRYEDAMTDDNLLMEMYTAKQKDCMTWFPFCGLPANHIDPGFKTGLFGQYIETPEFQPVMETPIPSRLVTQTDSSQAPSRRSSVAEPASRRNSSTSQHAGNLPSKLPKKKVSSKNESMAGSRRSSRVGAGSRRPSAEALAASRTSSRRSSVEGNNVDVGDKRRPSVEAISKLLGKSRPSKKPADPREATGWNENENGDDLLSTVLEPIPAPTNLKSKNQSKSNSSSHQSMSPKQSRLPNM